MKRTYLTLIIIMLVIGFAAVTTNLIFKGNLNIGFNEELFKKGIVFTRANPTNGKAMIEEGEQEISFTTELLDTLGAESELQYEVTNKSKQYDANVEINCKLNDDFDTYQNYVEIEQDLETPFELKAGESKLGNVTISLIKVFTEESKDIKFTCTIEATPTSREDEKEYVPETYSMSGYLYNQNEELLKNESMMIYSEEGKYVVSDDQGYVFVDGLEKGRHEIYYLGEKSKEEVEGKTKDEIKSLALSSSAFTIDTKEIIFENEYKIEDVKVQESEEQEYTVTIKTSKGKTLSTKNIKYGEKYGELPEVNEEHYSFMKWTVDGKEISEDTINSKNENHEIIAEISKVEAPVISSNHTTFTTEDVTITITTEGKAEKGIKNYEYYINSESGNNNKQTNITDTQNKPLVVSTVGTNYVAYRTVAEDGVRSEWSNEIITKIDRSAPENVQFSNKVIDENNVTMNVNYIENESNITQTICYYGNEENNVSSQVNGSNNKCVVPATASYAKVCVVNSVNQKACSNVKQLAMYFIKDGKLKVDFEKTSNIITNEYSGYYQIKTEDESNVNREGIYTTKTYDFSQFGFLYAEHSYETEITNNCNPEIKLDISNNKWLLNEETLLFEYNLWFYIHHESPKGTKSSGIKKINSLKLNITSNRNAAYLNIGRNSSFQNMILNLYNVWFQYKD